MSAAVHVSDAEKHAEAGALCAAGEGIPVVVVAEAKNEFVPEEVL